MFKIGDQIIITHAMDSSYIGKIGRIKSNSKNYLSCCVVELDGGEDVLIELSGISLKPFPTIEKWDRNNLIYIDSEEYKYLTKIMNLAQKTDMLNSIIREIYMLEDLNIREGDFKTKFDLNSYLKEVNKLISSFEKMRLELKDRRNKRW